jgi:RNA polymerase sigma-70 factor (ECF subfamily)
LIASEFQTEDAARQAVELAAREHFGRLLAILIKDLRDFQLAEDSLQDALESAFVHWSRSGPPLSPPAWLLQTARRKAIDRIRRMRNFDSKALEYGYLIQLDQAAAWEDVPAIPDERLRLIFTCCHPALDPKTRVALTLRTLCGLTTTEIARAFVDSEDAMAQRLVRARHKIDKAGIPYEIPEADAWDERLVSVLAVIYLVFNEGYAATAGAALLRADLCEEAIRLARIMAALRPGEPETEGLLALMLLTHARRAARTSADGALIPLEEQDRGLWNRELIREGTMTLEAALRRGRPGAYQLQAAISAVHSEAKTHEETRWEEIALLYDRLHDLSANPVFLVNGAVALSFSKGPQAGLDALVPLERALGPYQPYFAAKADMLRRAGRVGEAKAAYERAVALSQNASERAFLEARAAKIWGIVRKTQII